MDASEAVALIAPAVPRVPGAWADVGAGEGVFTRALVERLGPGARVYAVDRDRRAIAALGRWAKREAPGVIPVVGDFTRELTLQDLAPATLDGLLLANALHFVPDPAAVLGRLATWLRPGGRVVLVEYDRRRANPWVPHPIPASTWSSLAAAAGLSNPAVLTSRPSAYGGELYVAIAERPAAPP